MNLFDMELFETIYTRRSIRKYTERKIEDEKIKSILKAGMYAPSARNCRPWHFILIDDPEKMYAFSGIHPYAKMLTTASHGILVCGDQQLENGPGYWIVDCGAATQNLLLAAHALGLGAVWLGIHPKEDRKEASRLLFNLPPHIQPFAMISLGYPAEEPKFPERFDSGKIRYNTW